MEKIILAFDFDGVIVDSADFHFNLQNKQYELFGIKKLNNFEEFANTMLVNWFEHHIKLGVSKEELEKAADFYEKELMENLDKLKVFPKLVPVLKKLAENAQLMIISSNLKVVISKILEKEKITAFSDIIDSREEQSKKKKIEKVKKENPYARIYYIGDTVGDIREAKDAGVISIAATWGFHNKELLEKEKPDYLLETPEELLKIKDLIKAEST